MVNQRPGVTHNFVIVADDLNRVACRAQGIDQGGIEAGFNAQ